MKPETPQITFQFNQRGTSYGSEREAAEGSPPASVATLDLIRAFDGLDTPLADDARRLADHLIEDETARETWPGNLLFCFFVHSYEQDSFRPSELNALARIVEGVLIQIDGAAPSPIIDDSESADEPPEEALQLPDLAHFDQLGLNQAEGFPEIFFEHMQCDCLDWQSVRRKLAVDSPGRLCKHLSRLIHLNTGHLPPISTPLRRLIDWAGDSTQALPPHPEWRVLINEPEPMIAAWGAGKTFSVFANSTADQFMQFTYHIGDRQWLNNQRPAGIDDPVLRTFLAEVISEAA